MRIDIAAIRAAAGGDPSKKVSVSKAWLGAVADALATTERLRLAQRREAGMDAMLADLFRPVGR